jgi:hypothetical protein
MFSNKWNSHSSGGRGYWFILFLVSGLCVISSEEPVICTYALAEFMIVPLSTLLATFYEDGIILSLNIVLWPHYYCTSWSLELDICLARSQGLLAGSALRMSLLLLRRSCKNHPVTSTDSCA